MSIMQPFTKSYELPLSRSYVRHWGMAEAVREIIQNALDSDSPFEYEFGDDSLIVRSRNATLKPSSLLLGATTKAEQEDTIGSFGEGYKIALLVLTREGYEVVVHNGGRDWTPRFKPSKQFDDEVLVIEDAPAPAKIKGLAFEVKGLSPADIATIKDSCLHMQDHIGAVLETKFGLILRHRPGKLYIGSLYICDTQLTFGYDIKPQFLALERDRKTVRNFDLQWQTKEMWFETGRLEEIATLMEQGIPDLEYAEHSAPEFVKEACYRNFMQKHPGKVIAKDQDELQKLVKQGMQVVISTSRAYTTLVSSHQAHQKQVYVHVITPEEIIHKWFDSNRRYLRKDGIVAYKALLAESKNWKALGPASKPEW